MEINRYAIATAYTLHVFVCIYSMYDCIGETDQGPQEGYPVKVSKFMTLFYHNHHTYTMAGFWKTDQTV